MIDQIKRLREETGASIGEIRSALAESRGDMGRARELLSKKLGAMAEKKAGREVRSGVVDAYIHSNGKIGALIEFQCETDFVARNPEFRKLAHDLAMHIAAMAPAHGEELALQDSIHQPGKTVGEIIREAIGRFGENIKIGNFVRFEL